MTAFHAFLFVFSRMEIKEILENTLRKEPNLLSDKGEIKKWIVINKAQNYDETLLGLLLDEPRLKTIFFKEIKQAWVFNLNLFTGFIEQKEFLPDSYTGFPNKIGLQIGGKFLRQRNEVSLVWPYKDCVLEGGQSREEDTRKEIFFNELLAQDEITQLFEPKVITNLQYFGDATELTPTSNLLIKGNNLLALHSLKKCFTGKVKLIYIDPPYNTGNDSFRYNDSFNHSSWLTFMKNRLEVAKTLLSEDGVIFIQCDDNEQAYLKVLCDEVYGRDNFINTLPWKGRGGRQDVEHISDIHEFILLYAKNFKLFNAGTEIKDDENFNKYDIEKDLKYKAQLLRKWGSNSRRIDRPNLFYPIKSPDGDEIFPILPNGDDGCWRWSQKKVLNELELRNIEFFKQGNNWIPYQKIYEPREGEVRTKKFTTWLDSMGSNAEGSKELKNIFGEKVFDYPKPVTLIKHLLKIGNIEDDDIILDFFAGSGTTAQAVLDLNKEDGGNRQFIVCEQMEYIETVTKERIRKVIEKNGGGGFVYLELKKHNEYFIEKIRDAKSSDELLAVWEEMKKVSFLNYNIDIKDQDKAIEELKTHSLEVQKQKLVSILDKNQLYVSVSNIDDAQYGVTDQEKEFTKAFYQHD
jgi:adenine-specific DNA-methyltransferase